MIISGTGVAWHLADHLHEILMSLLTTCSPVWPEGWKKTRMEMREEEELGRGAGGERKREGKRRGKWNNRGGRTADRARERRERTRTVKGRG